MINRASGIGWKRLVVGNEKEADFHIARLKKHVRLEVKHLLIWRRFVVVVELNRFAEA